MLTVFISSSVSASSDAPASRRTEEQVGMRSGVFNGLWSSSKMVPGGCVALSWYYWYYWYLEVLIVCALVALIPVPVISCRGVRGVGPNKRHGERREYLSLFTKI